MKKIKFLSALMALLVMFSAMPLSAHAIDEVPATTCAAIYLADMDSGHVYFERNSTSKVYPASTTKIMTVLLVLEQIEAGNLSLDDKVVVQEGFDHDMDREGSSAQIVVDEILPLKDLLYCLLLASANEAANVVAVHTYGTIDGFVTKMNERARELGCTNTNFANPHGLHNENHYTTAYDLYLIASEAMKHELFATIVDTIEYTVAATNKSDVRGLTNTNGLITSAALYANSYYEPAFGIKTGYTSAAGYCLASAAKSRDIRAICIALGGTMNESVNGTITYTNFTDSISLFNWVFSNFTRMELVEGESIILEVPVNLASDADTIALRAETNVTGVLPNDADLTQLQQNITIYSEEEDLAVEAPITEGQVLGEISVSLNGVEYGKTYLVANRSVSLSIMSAMINNVFKTLANPYVRIILLLLVLAAITYITLVARYRMRVRKREAELAEARLQKLKLEEQAKREAMMAEARRRSYHTSPSANRSNAAASRPHSVEPTSREHSDPRSFTDTRDYFDEFFRD